MALSKKTVIKKIEIAEDGAVGVVRVTYVVEDGKRIAESAPHRTLFEPGDARIEQDDPEAAAIAEIMWTPERITKHQERVAARVNSPSR